MCTQLKGRWLQALCTVVVGSGLVTAQADYATQVLANGPIAYWRLNDEVEVPKGDVARNTGSLGSVLDGYYLGAAQHPVPGALVAGADTAAGTDGTSGTVVSIPYSPALNPSGPFTVEVWLNPNVENPAGTLTCAISSGIFSDPRTGWLIYQSDTGWNFRMYFKSGLTTSVNITGGPAPVAGTWHHLVAMYDGTKAYVYVNGAKQAEGTPSAYVPSAGGPLHVGGRTDNAFMWNGYADELAVYDKALDPAVITAHYQNGTSAAPSQPYNQLILASSPVGYYRLNEEAYVPPTVLPVAKNWATSGTAYDGSWNPGAVAMANGPQPPSQSGFAADNFAGEFNGLGGHVGTPVTLNDLTAFTIMGWIKRGAIHSARGGYFGQNDVLEFGDADGGANIEAWSSASGQIKIPYPFADNQWGFLALTGDGKKITLYANGLPVYTLSSTVASYGSSSFNFNVGGGGVFNASGDAFMGLIDEVAVFDRALTDGQISQLYFEAKTAPTIIGQPKAPTRDIFAGNVVTLSVTAIGNPTLTYQWRKGGADLPGKTAASLVFDHITEADAGSYDVVVGNPYGSTTSTSVTLTVKPGDSVPPTILYATGNRLFNGVRIWFSDSLDPVSAQNPANYQLTGGLTVTAASLSAAAGTAGDNIVDLTTSAQTPGTMYTVTVSGVYDQVVPANVIAPGSSASFSSWVVVPGLTFEHYDNLTGAADSDITRSLQDPRVIAGTPTTAGFISNFDTRTIFPDDSHENYMARMSGWITPAVTGDYYFFLASDDAGRLYLSKTEAIPDPNKDAPICTEPDCCDGFYEPDSGDPATTPTPTRLEAGKRYGILALLKEAGGGDWLRVGWREAGDFTPAGEVPNISVSFLSTSVDPNVDMQFTKQPTDQPGTVTPQGVQFAAGDFTTGDGGMTVVNTDPAPPGPWIYDPGNGEWMAEGGSSGCGGPYNSQLNSPAFKVPQDNEVVLTFSHRYSFEVPLWDCGQVRVSVNGGAFTLVPAENFLQNGYAHGQIVGSGIANGQRGFNGDSAGYGNGEFITSKAILGSFKKDDSIVVQFVGAWDDCTTASIPGWVIKNFQLSHAAMVPSTFTAEATASQRGNPMPVTYQWQRDDGAGFVDIPYENGASFRIYPVAADFNARFRVLARVPGKDLASNAVRLTSGADPTIGITTANGIVTITFTGKLQTAVKVEGPYTDVGGAQSPYAIPNPAGTAFYRTAK